jgi:hypothetical protein
MLGAQLALMMIVVLLSTSRRLGGSPTFCMAVLQDDG